MSAMRLRFQMNNVATWARNKWNIDPETVDPFSGATLDKTPRSYTVSLNINFNPRNDEKNRIYHALVGVVDSL